MTISSSASAGCPAMPEAAGPLPFVHVAAAGQGGVLAVLGQGHAERGAVLQGPSHQAGVLHAGAVVGEQPHAESAISAIGASCWPGRPTVMAPATRTSQQAEAPRSSTSRTTAAESMAGSVLGMATTAV